VLKNGGGQVARLAEELEEERRAHAEKQQALRFEADQQRQATRALEARLGGLAPEAAKAAVEEAATLREALEAAKAVHAREAAEAAARLEWYSENQELVDKNDALIRAQVGAAVPAARSSALVFCVCTGS